jgi:hypothetical protein
MMGREDPHVRVQTLKWPPVLLRCSAQIQSKKTRQSKKNLSHTRVDPEAHNFSVTLNSVFTRNNLGRKGFGIHSETLECS